jgi:ribosome-associated protein
MIEITHTISLRDDEVQIDFVQASGPGGQNVNKVASKVQLRFDTTSSSLPDEVRARLLQIARNRITEDGVLIIQASRFRMQEQNRQDAINRLIALILQASQRPKVRRKTKPTLESQHQRLENKRRRSEIKRLRSGLTE